MSQGVGPQRVIEDRVAAALKIDRKTVYRIKKRKEDNPVLTSPAKHKPRPKLKTKDLKESSKMDIRNTLYNMYKEKKHVTIKSLNAELSSKEIVSLSNTSLGIVLKDIGFKYKKDENRRALMERTNIASLRARFLREYMESRDSAYSRQIIF
ncbi:hypothetical protein ABEB36_000270 [Hypothenemus hampei]|uniref:Uncharacterized protein n=1 Tax=Hypothenemus hampei TaxID=57062 RepID=A0ABD1FAR5_HYPHA